MKCIFVDKSKNLSNGNVDVDSQLWGSEAILGQCLPLGYHSKIIPNSTKHCDLPGCIFNDTPRPWKRFDECWHAFHDSCVDGKVTCPICKLNIRKEISRLASIAKKAVSKPLFASSNQSSESDVSEQNPAISETSDIEVNKAIADMESEMLCLSPPSLSVENTVLVSVIRQGASRGNHCKICHHVIQGHKGKDTTRLCPMCPDMLCTEKGK